MSGVHHLRVSKIILIIIAIFDILIALGFIIKASWDKSQHYKYIYNETEWNSLYFSMILSGALVLYALFRQNLYSLYIAIAVKVLAMLCIAYAVIRGKLDITNCERQLCRFEPTCPCYDSSRKNKFEYEYTPKWLIFLIFELIIMVTYLCLVNNKPKTHQKIRTVHHHAFTTFKETASTSV